MHLIITLLIISLLVLVHELGHFLTAKKAGIKIEEFGFGLPPRLVGKRVGETLYSLNLLPFGGFVRLSGEDEASENTPSQRQFLFQSKKIRTVVLTAGVVANLAFGLVAFSTVYSVSGIPTLTDQVKVIDVFPNSPAAFTLAAGDIITQVNQQEVTSISQFTQIINDKEDTPVTLTIQRNGEVKTVSLTPRSQPPEGEGPLGVVISQTEIIYPPLWQRPFVGAWYGLKEALFWGWATVLGLAHLFIDLFTRGALPQDIAGPVGIYQLTGFAAESGVLGLLNFTGILSINLAIINILPLPALDGGRLLFVFLEKLRGQPVNIKFERAAHVAGMVLLLSFIFAVTINDILRLTGTANLGQLLTRLFSR